MLKILALNFVVFDVSDEDSGDLPSSKSKKSKSSSLSNGKEKGRSRTLLSSAEKAEKKKFMQQEYKKRVSLFGALKRSSIVTKKLF